MLDEIVALVDRRLKANKANASAALTLATPLTMRQSQRSEEVKRMRRVKPTVTPDQPERRYLYADMSQRGHLRYYVQVRKKLQDQTRSRVRHA